MSTPTIDVAEILGSLDVGRRVARETRGRWYQWQKDPRGTWKLDGRRVWLTDQEMANSPVVIQFDPARSDAGND